MSNWTRKPSTDGSLDYILDGDTIVCSRAVVGDKAQHEIYMEILLVAEENDNITGELVERIWELQERADGMKEWLWVAIAVAVLACCALAFVLLN